MLENTKTDELRFVAMDRVVVSTTDPTTTLVLRFLPLASLDTKLGVLDPVGSRTLLQDDEGVLTVFTGNTCP